MTITKTNISSFSLVFTDFKTEHSMYAWKTVPLPPFQSVHQHKVQFSAYIATANVTPLLGLQDEKFPLFDPSSRAQTKVANKIRSCLSNTITTTVFYCKISSTATHILHLHKFFPCYKLYALLYFLRG